MYWSTAVRLRYIMIGHERDSNSDDAVHLCTVQMQRSLHLLSKSHCFLGRLMEKHLRRFLTLKLLIVFYTVVALGT
jgi:hypothetical protein